MPQTTNGTVNGGKGDSILKDYYGTIGILKSFPTFFH